MIAWCLRAVSKQQHGDVLEKLLWPPEIAELTLQMSNVHQRWAQWTVGMLRAAHPVAVQGSAAVSLTASANGKPQAVLVLDGLSQLATLLDNYFHPSNTGLKRMYDFCLPPGQLCTVCVCVLGHCKICMVQ
jgi:hypothetical protein